MESFETLLRKNNKLLVELQQSLGYQFNNPACLQEALIHSSFAFEQGDKLNKDNETLEFLGDAVLDLTVGFDLFSRFPGMNEGELTQLRAAMVNENHLTVMAEEIELGRYLSLGRGEDASNGRSKPSILSSAYEAVVGAIFRDGGYDAAAGFVAKHFVPWIAIQKKKLLYSDAKSRLQELTQEKYSEAPVYVLEKEDGPDHQKQFTVAVCFQGKILGYGMAGSKKEAEQKAAATALENMTALNLPSGKKQNPKKKGR
ncbi:MAG: ribonuclease III [Proteobacteria bacterium]|nr:ribonuclease III [Pseudomonadota bacterium]MBU1715882.1 ribonuclease III [Pseudomonadota bacterium]